MIVEDGGGGGGPLGDPLAGLTMPPGDPGSLGSIASQLSGWAGHLGQGAAGHRKAAAGVINSGWIGGSAQRCATSVETIAGAAATLGDALDHGSQILSTCQHNWSDAVTMWRKAQRLAAEAVADEQAHRRAGASAVAAMSEVDKTAHPTALSQAQAQADGTDGYQSPFRSPSSQLGQTAVTDATTAVTTAGSRLEEITAVVNVVGAHPDAPKDSFWATFMDLDIGGPATALTVPGTVGQLASWRSYAGFFKAFDEGDYAALSKIDPKGWAKVTGAADKYGANSYEAIKAEMEYLQDTSSDVASEAAAGAIPIDGLPGGALGDTLDLLGKVALPLAVIGDVYTAFFDDKASGLDRSLSVVNLGGLGLAASGTELGGTALGLLGVDAVVGWVPVVGEVLVAGTAIYLGTEWTVKHWSDITHWTDDTGKWISSTFHSAVNTGEHFVGKAAHDLDPLNW